MRFGVAVVGRPRDAALATVIAQYEQRAGRYWPIDFHEVREETSRGASPALVVEREGSRLLKAVGDARLVACDEEGTAYSSQQFAAWMQQAREAARDVTFVIGGAFGLAPSIRTRADGMVQLAPWTLPHELARLVLAEQLYRAGTIVRREPYHK